MACAPSVAGTLIVALTDSLAPPKAPSAADMAVQAPPSILRWALATPAPAIASAVTVMRAPGRGKRAVDATDPTSGVGPASVLTARPASTIPAPQPRAGQPVLDESVATGVAVDRRTNSIASGERLGYAAARRAALNATCGVAIEVPSYAA